MDQPSTPGRRKFIINAAKGSLALSLGLAGFSSFASETIAGEYAAAGFDTGLTQKPLPYKYNALEDVIDAQTMELHYSKHAAGYSKALQEAVAAERLSPGTSVETILAGISKYSTKMRNNAGGHYNHEMFWQCMRPKKADNKPTGKLLKQIEDSFTSFDTFKAQFTDAGKTRFGSGWAWLYADGKKLKIGSTPNQDNPLMDLSEVKGFPLLGLDVWEHAYYLKYQNRRPEYIENWWNVVNWDYVQSRFDTLG